MPENFDIITKQSMISIIICSRNRYIDSELVENIRRTIGCDYELTVIDNSNNKFSIFEAYNLGIKESKGNLFCFLHDDISFKSQNWGITVQDLFYSNPFMGLLGIAGGKIKTKMPSAWWEGGENAIKILQHYKNGTKEFRERGFFDFNLQEVAAIDGVFMVMRKDARISFDERFDGFHNYDLSISLLQRKYNKKVFVTSKILLEHFSEGNLNKSWYKSSSKFHRLYKELLPVYNSSSEKFNEKLMNKEALIGYKFVNKLLEQYLIIDAFYWWWQLFKLKPISKYHFKIFSKLFYLKNYKYN